MSVGYFDTVAQADTYFTDERLETWAWDDLQESGDVLKTKVLKQAYNRIYYDPEWELPTYTEASSEDLVDLRKANAEMAYYLAVHIADEDRRKGLQAQGVVSAGIVKEAYSEDMLKELPVPPVVRAILDRWKSERPFGAIDLERDEEESVNTKVHDF
jgi:hypothetical protein